MKMRKNITTLGLVTSAIIGASALVANASPNGPSGFARFDVNKDGAISKTEFTQTVAKMPAARMKNAPKFADVDTDKNGAISKTELVSAQSRHGHGPTSKMSAHSGVGWQWK